LQAAKKYDYIIAGAGCAGYSLLYHLLKDPILSTKKILVVDAHLKKSNDRTWCFWEDNMGPFESIVCKKWSSIEIRKDAMLRLLPTAPFEYKMIQGIDFYQFVTALAKTFDTVDWQEGHIKSIESMDTTGALITWEGGAAIGSIIFSSIPPQTATQQVQPNLWQHFKGIVVEMEAQVFDDTVARLMDFNVPQMDATGFMYLLPMSSNKALVEYTLFSPSILTEPAYDTVLNAYMEQHYKGISYKVAHTEMGAIPMTTKKFAINSRSVISIGTMGDAVKASTGYAFQFIQEQAKQIVRQIKQNHPIHSKVHHTRHHFYDAVLLYILENKKMAGAEIFARIFKKNKAATVFKFLSNTSNLLEDISIMRSLPTSIFLPAALKVLFRRS
jgi:lycopene beta-cyclase